MALIIENGSVIPNANTFVSLDDFKAYCILVGYLIENTDDEVSAALVRSANYLENRYRSRWVGSKASRDQSLSWPRKNVYDEDDYAYDIDVVPYMVSKAQCEVAIRDLKGTLSVDDAPENRITKRSEKLINGLSEESVEYAKPTSTLTEIDRIVGPLLANTRQIRLVRG